MLRRPLLLCAAAVLSSACTARNPAYSDTDAASGNSAGGGEGSSASSTSAASAGSAVGTHGSSQGPQTGTFAETYGTSEGLALVEFIDDAWDGEFAAGDVQGLAWEDEALRLAPGQRDGSLESRVFDAQAPTDWLWMRWKPREAYGAALEEPAFWNGTGYETGDVLVDELELLLNFEDDSFAPGEYLFDQAEDRDVVWQGVGAQPTTGVFGTALQTDDEMLVSRADVLDPPAPDEGGFTWSLWFRSIICPESTLIALDAPNAGDTTGTMLTFIGCDNSGQCDAGGMPGAQASGWIVSTDTGQLHRVCNSTIIDDGLWHHIALRRIVSDAGEDVDLFVDGQPGPRSSRNAVADLSIHDENGNPETFTVAGGNEQPYPGPGVYDQVAVWNRALSDAELQSLFLRGIRRVRLQVRACDDPQCTDTPFTGPALGYFVDPGPEDNHTVDLRPLALYGRYFQYRIQYQIDADVPSPAVRAVEIVGEQ